MSKLITILFFLFLSNAVFGQNVALPTAPNKMENGKRVGEWIVWLDAKCNCTNTTDSTKSYLKITFDEKGQLIGNVLAYTTKNTLNWERNSLSGIISAEKDKNGLSKFITTHEYCNDEILTGKIKAFYPNGNIKAQIVFVLGYLEQYSKYDETGKLLFEGHYESGIRGGVFKSFDKKQNKYIENKYDFGEKEIDTTNMAVEVSFEEEDLNVLDSSSIFFDENNKTINLKEKLSGEMIEYKGDGNIMSKRNFQNGLLHGLSSTAMFKNKQYLAFGKQHGSNISYNVDGTLSEDNHYKNGMKDSLDIQNLGTTYLESFYRNGEIRKQTKTIVDKEEVSCNLPNYRSYLMAEYKNCCAANMVESKPNQVLKHLLKMKQKFQTEKNLSVKFDFYTSNILLNIAEIYKKYKDAYNISQTIKECDEILATINWSDDCDAISGLNLAIIYIHLDLPDESLNIIKQYENSNLHKRFTSQSQYLKTRGELSNYYLTHNQKDKAIPIIDKQIDYLDTIILSLKRIKISDDKYSERMKYSTLIGNLINYITLHKELYKVNELKRANKIRNKYNKEVLPLLYELSKIEERSFIKKMMLYKAIDTFNVHYNRLHLIETIPFSEYDNFIKNDYPKSELIFLENVKGLENISFKISLTISRVYASRYKQNKLAYPFWTKSVNKIKIIYQENYPFLTEIQKDELFINEKKSQRAISLVSLTDTVTAKEGYNISLLQKGSALQSFQQMQQNVAQNEDLKPVFQQFINTKKELQEQYIGLDVREKLSSKANELEVELMDKSAVFAQSQKELKYTWHDVQNSLNDNEIAIEYLKADSAEIGNNKIYGALLLRKGWKAPLPVTLSQGNELSVLLTKPINQNQNGCYKKDNLALYDLLWKNLEPHLEGIKTIYYAPMGNLHQVAFGAIPIGNGQFLSDKYNLVQMGSTRQVVTEKTLIYEKPKDMVVFSDINYDKIEQGKIKNEEEQKVVDIVGMSRSAESVEGIAPLKFSKIEGKNIEEIATKNDIKVTNYTKNDANESVLKDLSGKSPTVIHLPTHGKFLPLIQKEEEDKALAFHEQPLMRSELALAGYNDRNPCNTCEDGHLYAYEISNLNLTNTQLVVLSACESALGDVKGTEGVYGLQRAFKLAGAKHLIASLWKVDDEKTQEFMTAFYRFWLNEKLDIRTAFQKTQATMREKYRNNPYYWAAFVLIE